MTKPVGFIVGRKGIVHLVREDGKRQKCGFAVRDDGIWVFDRVTSRWEQLPEQLTIGGNQLVHIVVIEG